MNRKTITLIAALFVVLLLAATNPGIEEHKATVKAKLTAFMNSSLEDAKDSGDMGELGEGFASLVGGFAVNKVVDEAVSRDSYLLFSTTKYTTPKETKVIGLGILGKVFLSGKVDEAIKGDKSEATDGNEKGNG